MLCTRVYYVIKHWASMFNYYSTNSVTKIFVTARVATRAKVMFSEAFVCPTPGGGGEFCQCVLSQHALEGIPPLPRHTPLPAKADPLLPRQTPPEKANPHPCQGKPPPPAKADPPSLPGRPPCQGRPQPPAKADPHPCQADPPAKADPNPLPRQTPIPARQTPLPRQTPTPCQGRPSSLPRQTPPPPG